ncbi:hypothetical protein NUH30_19010 [Leptospira sp. 85282-16]|uniref:hypothetical protein n=1 Tax=Leptospira sp. 85282-16 TaxID=2971256 RepID=UPI0021C0CF30|nr:hypothetical protein [Leptospira sp. 85282-16]MCT8335784.1 hypothetical protein [Leptospira sp. 85282-16]
MNYTKDTKRIKSWIEEYLIPRYPELVQPMIEAYDAFDHYRYGGYKNHDLLDKIILVATSHRGPLYENGTDLLAHLTQYSEKACEKVLEMTNSSKSQTRFNSILCVDKNSPLDFKLILFRNLLNDKSKRVKSKAWDWIERIKFKEILPDMFNSIMNEKDKKLKKSGLFSYFLLKDGYYLRDGSSSETKELTVVTKSGLNGRTLTLDECNSSILEKIIKEMQNGY